MRILILQSGRFDHFLTATRAVSARYPAAELTGLVREADLPSARESGAFTELYPLPSTGAPVATPAERRDRVDICVVPFEDRLGVYYWRFRRIPIILRIPTVVSYNRRGKLRQWRRTGWLLNSILVCAGIRAVHAPMRWIWSYLRRWLDVVGLFGLAGIALVLRGCKELGIHPLGLKRTDYLRADRQRLVLFIPSLGLGGAQRQLVSHLKHLDRSRWDPELVTLDMPDKFFEPAVRALDVPITYLNPHGDYWMIGVIWRLIRHLRARPCHILHNWLHYAAGLGAIAGTMVGIPTIIGSLRSQRPGRFPWFYPKWQRGLDVLTAPLHTYLIANSEAVREENRRWAFIPKRKLVTVYNGIDLDECPAPDRLHQAKLKANLHLPAGAPLVGIVGRLSPEKDHGTFLKAALVIARARPDTHFLIIGNGRLRRWIDQEIIRLRLAERVRMLEEREDVLALIQALDVLVLTSTSEGFPNVLLEAAAAGTAVVTTAAGGASEIVSDGTTGFVVPCGDSEALAERVLELLDDPVLRTRFVEAARAKARAFFSADQAASAIQACYAGASSARACGLISQPRLHICFISPYAYGLLKPSSGLPVGGAEVQICRLAGELARDPRFQISVLTGDARRTGKEQSGPLTIVLSPLCAGQDRGRDPSHPITERARLWLTRCPVGVEAGLRWLVHRGREAEELFKWLALLRAVGADMYVMRCASPQVAYAKLACTFLRRTFIYMVAHEHEVSGQYAETHGTWGKRFEWGLRRADAIVCQHAEQVGLLQARYRRTGRLIRSVSPIPVTSHSGTPRKTILWMARLDEWKQPELFIELADRIREELFVLVGPPGETDLPGLPRLRLRAAGIPNLQWLPGAPFENTARLFMEAKLFVNTSRTEGFPNTFLQAAAWGTPIVSWAVNPDGILDRYQIGYCADQDWTRFEQSIRLLCTDPALCARLGENGRRYVQAHHDPAAIAAQYTDLFVSLGRANRAGTVRQSPPPMRDGARQSVAGVLREH